MSNIFYKVFEEKYHGSFELIKARLQVYLPFIQPLIKFYPSGQALDLGCGRGEWLELLTEQGFNAKGIDLDEDKLHVCREKGLQVETADALAFMQALPDSSLCIVSGFHVAEHLKFDVLQQLVIESKRLLVPGGLLILETSNPEKITVGTSKFDFDTTYHRPISPELLSLLPEHYGFCRSKLLRLQEPAGLSKNNSQSPMQVFDGVSADYAVIAQTDAVTQIMEEFVSVFSLEYGTTLNRLADKYQTGIEQRLRLVETKAQQAEAVAQQAEHKAHQAEVKSSNYATELNDVYNSASWRSTAPLRWIMIQWRLLILNGFNSRFKACIKKFIHKIIQVIVTRPKLKQWAIWLAYRLKLAERLKPFVHTMLKHERVVSFQQLRSVRIMLALSVLPKEKANSSVTFLELNDDGQ